MEIVNEKYIDTVENFNKVHTFLNQMVTRTGKLQTWEFVRFEFWKWREATKSTDADFMENNAHLWKNEAGEVVGLFISESGGEFFSLIVHPDYQQIAKEMAAWAKNVWGKDKMKLNTDCYEHSLEVQALLDCGFVRDSVIGNTRRYDLQHTAYTVSLEEGFSVQDMTETVNEGGKHVLIERTFSPDNPHPEQGEYWRKNLPSYRAALDLSVVDRGGHPVAFCFGFVAQDKEFAVIETVGTHPDYQQRGFGKAVISTCFKRLQQQGVKSAYITGFSVAANALYQSLQPVEIFPMSSYRYEK